MKPSMVLARGWIPKRSPPVSAAILLRYIREIGHTGAMAPVARLAATAAASIQAA
jgi:hypothetical protein